MNRDELCHEDERIDDLQNNGLLIIQKPDGFCFGMDSVLLAHFAVLRPKDSIVDLGTGTGILPILMSRAEPTASFHAFERLENMADMARRSVLLNGLENRIHIYTEDFRNASQRLGYESMDAVVCNPPYGKQGSTSPSERAARLEARHETAGGLAETVRAGASVLKNRGRFTAVIPCSRALELFDILRDCRLEPKRVRPVCVQVKKSPYVMLVEAVKNARPGLTWLPPLIVLGEDGRETDEIRAIYGNG